MLKNVDIIASDILLSGGASGADNEFGIVAYNHGHQVVHWSFEGHKSASKKFVYTLPAEQLKEADPYIIRANKSVLRTFPTKSESTNNLIRRNYYQVKWVDSVYAVSRLDNNLSLLKIDGGTAWACQMYVDRFLFDQEPIEKCNLYLFDQISNKWLQWKRAWIVIDKPPAPTSVYAGIGSRKITEEGINAIKNLYT